MSFRFVHTADIHLDSPLRSLAMRNSDLAGLIGDATRQSLVSIVDLCIDERVDALMIAGDLYDGDQTSMKTARFLASQMQRLHEAGIATFVIRGNHDALSRITQELVLPPSVKVFQGRADAVELSKDSLKIHVHGLSFAKPQAPESLLDKYRRPSPDTVNIGIMHTSIAGAPGHDLYAPCKAADLHGWGYDYWALGHIHARAQHAGDRMVIMPGIPQGRDINEGGEKSATLVTVHDDRSISSEERLTSIAQFERISVDLSSARSWREAAELVEQGVGVARDGARSAHLVGRLQLAGATPLSWQLRRDRELLLAEIEQRAEGLGKVWIEKIEIATTAPVSAQVGTATADPVLELGELMRSDIIHQHGVREAVGDLVKELRDDLPPEARGFSGDDEAAFEALIDQLLTDGSEDMLARLKPEASEIN
ncbi:3',5'-cyclic adenosine monophosphate phosphodiesterase CpdA [Pleomorphomonas sp. T1.2MG-36]|uniref:metallophosphoesterase family protein n=1 Tax=Pleomorphomonas sp. T1.2MG-36 TaxID=3041167 RepID=UPI00247748F2|nr:DNA repair exonuclease [Pleomorphomonas sp. T1.2MG-36]CAI9418908.1 3',5'-cyclic adenosine monophosphate phosphodiesterase CpdA [Pleomorphomonas sp. T1.2MG-36]